MHPDFWHNRWQTQQTAFHELKPNDFLTRYFNRLGLSQGDRIFVPLCGKTLDIGWLLAQSYCVAGAELSPLAVEHLFEGLGISPHITHLKHMDIYSGPYIDICVGNIFDLTADILGPVNAIYDRAALVALPADMRLNYSRHLMELTHKAPQLLICYEYDQTQMNGPPFCVTEPQLHDYYGTNYNIELIMRTPVLGGLRGQTPAHESVLWLKPL